MPPRYADPDGRHRLFAILLEQGKAPARLEPPDPLIPSAQVRRWLLLLVVGGLAVAAWVVLERPS